MKIQNGNVSYSNPLFDHRRPVSRVIVESGVVVDPERFAEINTEGLALTPEHRLGAIFKVQYAKPVKPKDELGPVQRYTPTTTIARKESAPLDDFELDQEVIPWDEAA
ncbi:MAG TPA: hypothetical protein VGQ49_00600 [Bryobacteraceae bacterium]|nr:hypothetical protein [Bryobacteraceae bacterium]